MTERHVSHVSIALTSVSTTRFHKALQVKLLLFYCQKMVIVTFESFLFPSSLKNSDYSIVP